MLCPRGESIPSWYEDRCEHTKYGYLGAPVLLIIQNYPEQME